MSDYCQLSDYTADYNFAGKLEQNTPVYAPITFEEIVIVMIIVIVIDIVIVMVMVVVVVIVIVVVTVIIIVIVTIILKTNSVA